MFSFLSLLFRIIAYAEKFMCWASVVKKFEFWQLGFGEKSPILVLQILVDFYLFLYLLISNTSCFQRKRLKTLNFGRPRLGGIPDF